MHRLLGLGFRDKALGFIRLEARGEESEFRDRVSGFGIGLFRHTTLYGSVLPSLTLQKTIRLPEWHLATTGVSDAGNLHSASEPSTKP